MLEPGNEALTRYPLGVVVVVVVILFRLCWARPLAFCYVVPLAMGEASGFCAFFFTVALSTRLRQLSARWCGWLFARNAVLN